MYHLRNLRSTFMHNCSFFQKALLSKTELKSIRIRFIPKINGGNTSAPEITCSKWATKWFGVLPDFFKEMPICALEVSIKTSSGKKHMALGIGSFPFSVYNEKWWCFNIITLLLGLICFKMLMLALLSKKFILCLPFIFKLILSSILILACFPTRVTDSKSLITI